SSVVVNAGGGDDFVDCRNVNVPTVLNGGNGNDVLYGGSKNDLISGNDGHDVMVGFGGDDFFYADGNDSSIDGGDGYDTVDIAFGARYPQQHAVYHVEAYQQEYFG